MSVAPVPACLQSGQPARHAGGQPRRRAPHPTRPARAATHRPAFYAPALPCPHGADPCADETAAAPSQACAGQGSRQGAECDRRAGCELSLLCFFRCAPRLHSRCLDRWRRISTLRARPAGTVPTPHAAGERGKAAARQPAEAEALRGPRLCLGAPAHRPPGLPLAAAQALVHERVTVLGESEDYLRLVTEQLVLRARGEQG